MTPDNVLVGLIYGVIGLGTALLTRFVQVSPHDSDWRNYRVGDGPTWSGIWLIRVVLWPLHWLVIGIMWLLWFLSWEF